VIAVGKRRGRNPLGDLTRRGLIARNCGKRMYEEGMDYVTATVLAGIDMRPFLHDSELEAYDSLSPAVWSVQWWRGWNDAGVNDLGRL
jgi:hypothetical protein